MPSESQFTSKLLRALRARMPNAVVLKHSDSFSGGIPDFSITNFDSYIAENKTVWIEVKLLGPPSVIFKPLQVEMLRRLGGYYLIWDARAKRVYFFSAACTSTTQSKKELTFKQLVEVIAEMF